VKGGAAQAAEVVVGVGHNPGFAATYPRGDLADVARFLGGGCGQARDAGEGLVVAGILPVPLFNEKLSDCGSV
jgi:hypothetical protein